MTEANKELDTVLADLDKAAKERNALAAAGERIRSLQAEVAQLTGDLKDANRQIIQLTKPPERPPELSIDEAKEAQRLFRAIAGSLDNYLFAKTEAFNAAAAAALARAAEENPVPNPKGQRRDLSAPWRDPG